MENKEEVGKALGKVASGLYIITTKDGDTFGGFTASFLVQVAFEPPLIAVSMKKGRSTYDMITKSGVFTVNIMPKEGMKLIGHFANPKIEHDKFFDGISYELKGLELPVLVNDAIAYLECNVYSTVDAGDHIVLLGEIVGGEVLKEGEPATHVRKNGFSY